MPKSVINDLKEGKTTAEEFLGVVKEGAAAMHFDYSMVEMIGKSSIGLWNSITGNISAMLRSMGKGLLESIKPRLEKISGWFDSNTDTINRWKGNLIQFGKEGAERLLSFFERTFTHIRNRYLDNPDFQNMSYKAKIDFIMADISEGFNAWFNSGGREKVETFGRTIGEALRVGLLQVAPAIGASLGQAVLSAFTAALTSGPLGAFIAGAIPGAVIGSAFPGVGTVAGGLVTGGAGVVTWGATKVIDKFTGHASGLAYVPYDRYPAMLHRGERVLTASENRQYNTFGQRVIPEKAKSYASGLQRVPYDNYPAMLHRGERVMTAAENRQLGGRGRVVPPNVTIIIQGSDKSPREIAREVAWELYNELKEADMNMGQVTF